MNPLTSILGTIISGFVLAIIITLALGTKVVNPIEIAVWAHVLVGITWIGLLYYFNFVQVPAVGCGTEGRGRSRTGRHQQVCRSARPALVPLVRTRHLADRRRRSRPYGHNERGVHFRELQLCR